MKYGDISGHAVVFQSKRLKSSCLAHNAEPERDYEERNLVPSPMKITTEFKRWEPESLELNDPMIINQLLII